MPRIIAIQYLCSMIRSRRRFRTTWKTLMVLAARHQDRMTYKISSQTQKRSQQHTVKFLSKMSHNSAKTASICTWMNGRRSPKIGRHWPYVRSKKSATQQCVKEFLKNIAAASGSNFLKLIAPGSSTRPIFTRSSALYEMKRWVSKLRKMLTARCVNLTCGERTYSAVTINFTMFWLLSLTLTKK